MIGNIVAGITGLKPPAGVVTGGTLVTSGGFNYRTFTANGTLGITVAPVTFDILVVAGGGGGGDLVGGGGGGGGLLGFTSQTLATGNYTITVGQGGAAGVPGAHHQGPQGGAARGAGAGEQEGGPQV